MSYLIKKPTSNFIESFRGFKQHYLDWNGDNNPIILLHPKRSNARHWDHMVNAMKSSNRVIAPDLRGHGLSDYTNKGYTVPELAEDVLAFADTLEIEKAIFVGCATGGNLCIWLAANYESRVSAVGIIDPGLSVPKSIAQEVSRQTKEEHNFPNFEAAKSSMYFQELWSEEIKEHYAKHSFKKRGDGRWEWLYLPEAANSISESLNNDSVWGLSKKVQCPSFLLRGKLSPVFTQEHLDKLGKNIPHAKKINLEKASHTPAQENPKGLALEIDQLVEKFNSF